MKNKTKNKDFYSEEDKERILSNMGRPPVYTPEEIISKTLEYINTLTYEEDGEIKRVTAIKEGLRLYLGMNSTYLFDALNGKNKDISNAVKVAYDIITEYNHTLIYKKADKSAYDIFQMKNTSGWTDKLQTQNETTNTITTVNKVLGKEPTE